jgi:hypothetical protein
VTIENTLTPVLGALNYAADTGNHWGSDGDVGHKVAVHDVNVEPVGTLLLDDTRAFVRELAEVGGED